MGVGCGCAVVERAALTIAAAGAGAKILAPQGKTAVVCSGAALTLQGLAVEGPTNGLPAVVCTSKGRAELSSCTLTSPMGNGLQVAGATATMDGGSISGCSEGVFCVDSGSTATVRPPAAAPSAAPPCPLRAAGAAAFFSPASPFFAAVFWPIGTAVRKR